MTFRNKFSLLSVMFVFIFSAVVTIPAYADDGTPSGDVPVEVQPTEPPTQESAVEEAAPQTPPEPAAATSPVASILAEIPQDTQVVVMDEAGNHLPLATQEAANVIVNGDPMWCPVGVTPGGAGCTSATSSFETMISNLTGMYGSAGPSKAGVIWIEDGYNNTVNDSAAASSIFTLNGSVGNLTAMKDFALTIQGGWSGTGKVITPNGTSTFSGVQLNILNWNGDVTLNNIVISGAPGANGLQVFTTKNIVLTNVQSFNNSGRGALLQNDSGTGNVTVTNSQFIANMGGEGLRVESKGIITLKDVTANANTDASNGYGAFLYNQGASTPKAIVLSGTNTFNGNQLDGLYISSAGVITLNNIIASNNGSSGAQVSNNFNAAVPNGVTLTGINTFTDNAGNGLDISTYGPVKASNLYANSNDSVGVQIDNHLSNTSQLVTLTGTNEFKYNIAAGLGIFSKGQITLNNITANSNGTIGGAYLDNTSGTSASGITFTGANSFNLNEGSGLKILTNGTVLLNAITANGNGISGTGSGADINNGTAVSFKNVTITGVNSFSNNHDDGLKVVSSGIITLNNITASFNSMGSGDGANLDNTLSGMSLSGATIPKAIILAGTNEFNANMGYGLEINTYGAVTTNNITANDNISGYGAYIRNDSATLPQTVTLNGANKFNDNAGSGLYVISKGAIRTNALTANGNGGNGALLDNSGAGAVGGVTMAGVNAFSGNTQANLTISSRGAVVLNSITSDSSDADGATIFNTASSSAPVTITGTNSFTLNKNNGLIVSSNGLITVSNLTASNNGVTGGSYGAQLNNSGSPAKAGVNLTGVNSFIGNTDGNIGLQIYSLGNVKVSSVTAKSNGGIGVEINNSFANGIGSVTLIGTNIFSANAGDNLRITSAGIVSLTNINSTGATGGNNGAAIDNTILGPASPKAVTLSGVNVFSGNTGVGLSVLSNGLITASNITAESNGQQGAYFSNSSATLPAGVTLTGTNKFNLNGGAQGLYIETKGLISIASITASGNTAGEGASLNNNYSGATAGVTLSGFNAFNSNSTNGLTVLTNGAITISNLTATLSQNGYGVKLDNLGNPSNVASPKNVTLSGTNTFANNKIDGLVIDTLGAVLINNLNANTNGTGGVSGTGADIDNYQGGIATIASKVTLTGNNSFSGNYKENLLIKSIGAITINNLTSNASVASVGAELDNHNAFSEAFNVVLTGVNKFTDNFENGLNIISKGAVILSNVTAEFNDNGVLVDNTSAVSKPVTLTGTNVFSNNTNSGLLIITNGLVTASNVTASNNSGAFGASVDNSGAALATPAGVNFTGTNTFSDNTSGNGLLINSIGKITLNNITTNHNQFSGLDILNNGGSALTSGVTITGYGIFNFNSDNGATIVSKGVVNLTRITGDMNAQSGLVITTTSAITLTCGSFNKNSWYGWEILSATGATLKGVFTAGNGLGNSNNPLPVSIVTVRACPLP